MLAPRLLAALAVPLVALACTDPEIAKHRHVERGDDHAVHHRYAEAVLEYRNAIKLDRRFGEARYKLAEALANDGKPGDAAQEYVRAAELLPDRADVQIRAGGILLVAQEFERAQKAAAAALAVEPTNVDAQLILAHAYAGLKDLPGAVREIEEAIQLAPEDSRPYTSLGGLRLAEGDRAKAEAAYQRAVAIDPKSIPARLALGYFYWSGNSREQAAAELNQAIAIDPRHLLANRMLALFHLTAGQYAEAEPALLRLAGANDANAILTVADHYVRSNRGQEAREMYERLKSNEQTRTVGILRLASLDYRTGQTGQAHAAVDAALKTEAKNPELLILKTRFLLEERRFTDAETLARQAVEADETLAGAHYVLGLAQMALGRTDQASNAFKETLRLNPRASAAELQLSRLSLAAGDTNEALRRAEAARKGQPGSPETRLSVANALLSRRELNRAETELKPLLAEYPNSAAVRVTYGGLLAARADIQGAVREFDRALEIDPGHHQALAGRLNADLVLKKPEDGRARLTRALAASPNDGSLLQLAARFEATAGDFAASEQHLRRAIEVNPSALDAYSMLGQIYVRQNRLDQARVEFEKLAALRSDPTGPKTMVGMIYDLQKRTDDARKVYEEIVGSTNRAPVAANNLAWHYAESGERLDIALQLAQTAKQQIPDSHEVNDTLGWVYYKRGMADMAIRPLEESVKAAPGIALYHFHLGLAYAKAGRNGDARRSLEQALKLQPDFPGAGEARSALASLKG